MARVETVMSKGADKDKAEKLVASLASLDDAAFTATVELVSSSFKVVAPKPTEIGVLDNAIPEVDVALAAANDTVETTRAALSEFFDTNVFTTNRGRNTNA
jgi:hypothetical protein